jgi:serine protease
MRGYAVHGTISKKDLHYQGGTSVGGVKVGVTTGPPKVYLVFWGKQWGTQSKDSNGYATFSGDPKKIAPDLQGFFAGLGTGGELYSGIATQYCEGVATGLTKCPLSAKHVGYPKGGALAGVWEDTTASAPSAASAGAIGKEAIAAAKHFGFTTEKANRDIQYFIVSPTGTNPDHYKTGGFCAWHDYTGDSSLGGESERYIAFTNLPYIPDAGKNCGANILGGALDGVTIVSGHEYTETITDQFPAGGWLANNGEEIGDLCAWVTSGAGRMQVITLSTGKFPVQGEWSNAALKGVGGCAIKHKIVT